MYKKCNKKKIDEISRLESELESKQVFMKNLKLVKYRVDQKSLPKTHFRITKGTYYVLI